MITIGSGCSSKQGRPSVSKPMQKEILDSEENSYLGAPSSAFEPQPCWGPYPLQPQFLTLEDGTMV